jgi:hypothetical protein
MFLVMPLQHKATCLHGVKKALSASLPARNRRRLPPRAVLMRAAWRPYHALKEEFSGMVEIVSYLEVKGEKLDEK